MHYDPKGNLIDEGNHSVGNPALGLSDAIVGTYGPGYPGRCEQEDPGTGDKEPGIPRIGRILGPILDPVFACGGCCCGRGGGASDLLIDESEIVL